MSKQIITHIKKSNTVSVTIDRATFCIEYYRADICFAKVKTDANTTPERIKANDLMVNKLLKSGLLEADTLLGGYCFDIGMAKLHMTPLGIFIASDTEYLYITHTHKNVIGKHSTVVARYSEPYSHGLGIRGNCTDIVHIGSNDAPTMLDTYLRDMVGGLANLCD